MRDCGSPQAVLAANADDNDARIEQSRGTCRAKKHVEEIDDYGRRRPLDRQPTVGASDGRIPGQSYSKHIGGAACSMLLPVGE